MLKYIQSNKQLKTWHFEKAWNFLKIHFVSFVFSVNVGCGAAEERVLLTGLHAVADIFCECCKTTLGWKYVSKYINYKSGKMTSN